jgi:hypothetical protein
MEISGAKVFSATMAREREMLGEVATKWLRANPDKEIVEHLVRQSSDSAFHCISIIFFYKETQS